MRRQLRSALLFARAMLQFALANVVAMVAATVALLPLALRGRPLGARQASLEPPSAEERRAAVGEGPAGSP